VHLRRQFRAVKFLTTVSTVAGWFAMWAVRQSPYGYPDKLDKVVHRLRRELLHHARSVPKANRLMKAAGMFTIDQNALEDLILSVLKPCREFQKWNQRKNGNKAPFGISTRYDDPSKRDPDDDFIDLDALARNVAHGVAAEEIEASKHD
jgi:hypothetical protein